MPPCTPPLPPFGPESQPLLTHRVSTGIGAACAIALAEAGADICLLRRPGSTNDETANAIAALGRTVKIVDADLANLDAVRGIFAKALDVMGGEIHILVNCAGIQRRSPAVQFPESDWDDVRLPFLPMLCFCFCFCFCFSALSISCHCVHFFCTRPLRGLSSSARQAVIALLTCFCF